MKKQTDTPSGGADRPTPEWGQLSDGDETIAPLRYVVRRPIARGGMGEVHLVYDLYLDREVAYKVIKPGGPTKRGAFRRFDTEVRATARVKHKNVVQIYDVGLHNNKPYYTFEYCPDGSLDSLLAGAPVAAAFAAKLTEEVARAVAAAHANGVVHRDLKPSNILLAPDGTVKVTDFGLARLQDAEEQTRSGAVLGTPSYMAPEQARGEAKYAGPAADIYGLGAILYELMTGRPPFRGPTPLDTVAQVIDEEPVPPSRLCPSVPRDLEVICLTCLRKNPADRYATADAVADDLRAYGEGREIAGHQSDLYERIGRHAARKPAVAVAVCLVALLCGAIAFPMAAAQSDVVAAYVAAARGLANVFGMAVLASGGGGLGVVAACRSRRCPLRHALWCGAVVCTVLLVPGAILGGLFVQFAANIP